MLSGLDRSAVDKDGRNIEARHRDDGTGHVFVTATDGNNAIHALTTNNCFDGISNNFTGDEGKLHAFRAHRDSIGNRNCPKCLRHTAGFPDSLLGTLG